MNQANDSSRKYCTACGQQLSFQAIFCGSCGAKVGAEDADTSSVARQQFPLNNDERLIRQIADYEYVSGILWMVLGCIQVVTVIGIFAGVWNLFAGYSKIKAVPQIRARDSSVPNMFEGITQLIIIGLINVIAGGVIGIIFVVFDYIIRDKVLTNKHLFSTEKIAEVETAGEAVNRL